MDVDVLLALGPHEGEIDAALGLLDGHVGGLGGILGGGQVAAVHGTGEVQDLAQIGLGQGVLIGAAHDRSVHEGGAAALGGGAGHVVLEGDALGLVAGPDGGGEGEGQVLLAGVLVDVHGDLVVNGSADLHVLGGGVGGPLDVIGGGADPDRGDQVKVHQDLAGLVLVHGKDVASGVGQVVRLGGRGGPGPVGDVQLLAHIDQAGVLDDVLVGLVDLLPAALAAQLLPGDAAEGVPGLHRVLGGDGGGPQRHDKGQRQNQSSQFFHGYLPFNEL